ncbi:helix-hairpin-helix domain-containing protein [Streptomyces sp. NRRL F-5123]|uniref:helix-hairpin-helix domain-containing protein n=1 Tax=Streptomyces sp. NRRL F-5123 TaxID=1463856 RepID=UPI00099C16B0|nr:helix-hairpin-helix domain-containing protein [Streptomyces sp. NRRL F-5123]
MPPAEPSGLADLAAAIRSIERGENAAAPAPRGDAAAARRRRREAMAAEAAALQAAEAAEAAGATPVSPQAPAPAEDGAEGSPSEEDGAATSPAGTGEAPASAPGSDEPAAAAGAPGADTESAAPADADAGAAENGGGSGRAAEDGAVGQHAGTGPSGGADATQQVPGSGDGSARTDAGHSPQSADRDAGAPRRAGAEAPARPGTAGGGGGQRARGPVVPQAAVVDPAAVEAAAGVLVEGGAPAELAGGVVRVLGERAAQELREDPWLLLGLGGVRVEQADGFARGLLGEACGPGDERRARALVGRALEDAALHGHTALAPAELLAALGRYGLPEPQAAVATAVAEGQLLEFREGGDEEEEEEQDGAGEAPEVLFALDRYAMAEEALGEGFVRLLRSLADDGAAWAGAQAPTPSAAELIRAAAGSGLVVHSGGEAARAEPAALVAAARAAGLRAYAAAYSGSGRARLAADTGPDAAVTLDGLLSGAEGPGRAADGSLDLDLLAVLDAPQLSVEEAATLVESLPDGARLVLSGDPNALWSAGPGRVFADLLASRACPRVVSRTPDPGPIGELVSCVGIGELAAVDAPGKEVVVVPVHDGREAVHRTVQLVADSVPRAFGLSGPQVQVVTTGHGGPVGTRALNAALKERLNPGPGRFGGFDPGDRVVYVPAPGRAEPGTVAGAEPDGLRLECERGPVVVPRADVAAAVRHGWAVTGHQAAASRWPAAVVVIPGDAGPLLTRSWIYTAFSRGERHLSVVQGAEGRLSQAVAGPPAAPRTTRLPVVLAELAADA